MNIAADLLNVEERAVKRYPLNKNSSPNGLNIIAGIVTIKNFEPSEVSSDTLDKEFSKADACRTNQFESVSPKIHHVTPAVIKSTARVTRGPAVYHHKSVPLNPISLRAFLVDKSHGSGQMIIIDTGMRNGLLNPPKRTDACKKKIMQTMIHECGISRWIPDRKRVLLYVNYSSFSFF